MAKNIPHERRRGPHLFLVGFSGSGKSTVGPVLAKRLNRRFFDSDQQIEKSTGISVSELFSRRGEKSFRGLELRTVSTLATKKAPSVIALGGGALLKEETKRVVFASGTVVYLRCSVKELHRRLAGQSDRPLLNKEGELLRDRIRNLFPKRKPGYDLADIKVSTTTRTASETIHEILSKLKEASWR